MRLATPLAVPTSLVATAPTSLAVRVTAPVWELTLVTGAEGRALQAAAVDDEAMSAWPDAGVPLTLVPLTFRTLGLAAVPPRSPLSSTMPLLEVVASLTVVELTVEAIHWLVVLS